MASATLTNTAVTKTISTSNNIGNGTLGANSSDGTGVAATGGAGGIGRSAGGAVGSSSGGVNVASIIIGSSDGGGIGGASSSVGESGSTSCNGSFRSMNGSADSSCCNGGCDSTSISGDTSVGGIVIAVGSGPCSGGGCTTVISDTNTGGGISAISPGSSDGGGSSAASGHGGSSAGSSGHGGGSTAVSSAMSGGGGSAAVSSGTSSGGNSSAGSSASSGNGSSSGSSISVIVSGGSIAGTSGGPCMISQNEINWYRIGSLLYNGILPAMLSVLHNDNSDPYVGLPRDPAALYNELMRQKPVIDKLAGKPRGPKIINKQQMQVLYPKTKTTNSGEFDITLTVILIRNLLKLPKPQARWDRPVKSNDSTITANICRGQEMRNFFSHHRPNMIDTPTLDNQFTTGERILKELKYTKCDTRALKSDLIDERTYSMVKTFTQKEKNRLDNVETRVDAAEKKVNLVESRVSQKVDAVKVEVDAANKKADALEVHVDAANKTIEKVEVQVDNTDKKVDEVEYRVKKTELRLDVDAKQIEAFEYRIEKLENRESTFRLIEDRESVERADKTMRSQYISNDAIALKRPEKAPSNIILEDDGTSHFHFIQNTNWSIWTHHSKRSNPSEILHSFKRSKFIPNDITCQLYECGYTKHYKEHEMDEYHLRKFRRLFSEDMKSQPWLLTNLHVDCVKSLPFYEFLEKLSKWCTNKEYSFMLLNYSSEEHLRMLNVNVNELRLSIQNSELDTENELVLVYIATDEILMNIRFVSSSGSESENKAIIDQAVLEGQNDVKLFTSLHMSMCKDFNITLVSLTILNNITRTDLSQSVCTRCSDILIITQDELKENILKRKLDTIVARKRKISAENETSTHSCPVGDCFELLSSRLWGWLCTKDVYLPNMSIHGPSCLARIYLNNEQFRFMHLKRLHLMLKGPYGSGKSIMGMTKFRDLAVKATSSSRLYFICCSSNTMYTALMKSRLCELLNGYLAEYQLIVLNLDEYAEQFGLPEPVMVSHILQDMAERHKEHASAVGVIFDEYDASLLTEQEARHMNRALLKLKDSYILILCQSMETTRTKVIKERSGLITKKNKTMYDAFMFGLTSMQIETFHLTMRNCTRVNELSRVATQVIENMPNEFFEREMINYEERKYSNDSLVYNHAVGKKTSFDSLTKEASKESIGAKLEPGTKETLVTKDKETHSGSEGKDNPQRKEDNETLVVSGLFDHLIKNLGNTSQTYTGVRIKSTFKFPGQWMNGHSVEGDIPQLIYPFGNDVISYDNVNSFENKVRMGFALEFLIGIPTRLGNIGVICFDPIDAQLFHNVLVAMDLPVKFYVPVLLPAEAVEVAPNLRECAQSHIIITDHVGAQGLELNELIVSIDPNEKYVHQYLVEALTRCVNTLFVILISKQTTEVKERGGACKKIVNDWIRNDLVEVSKVTFCKAHQKDSIESPICKDLKSIKKKTYHIHDWHKDFESYAAISNLEPIPIDIRRLAKMSETISNTHHVKEAVDRISTGYASSSIAIAMEKMDVKSFAIKYKTKQLRKIRDASGNTLLDLARQRSQKDYVVWLKSIGVPGSRVFFQYHRGLRNKFTVDKNNMVKFEGTPGNTTVAAPELAITPGGKAMYEVTFHSGRATLCRIGWASPRFLSEDDDGGRGEVGDCAHSYSYQPFTGKIYHNNHSTGTPWGIEAEFRTTKVLGVAADLNNGSLMYAWDGNWEEENMGVAFTGLPRDIELYPVISCYWDAELEVRFSEHVFMFKPPNSSFKGINDEIQ